MFDGGRLPGPVTVHAPLDCHPEKILPLLIAPMDTVLAPENPRVKLIARFTVRLFPAPLAVDAPRSTVHWLLASVVAVPSAPPVPVYPVPASFSNCTLLLALAYWT